MTMADEYNMAEMLRRYTDLKAENKRLRELLDLNQYRYQNETVRILRCIACGQEQGKACHDSCGVNNALDPTS